MDGYERIYAIMRSAAKEENICAPVWPRICNVLSTDPLKVDVCGTTQEAGRFYIPLRMLDSNHSLTGIQAGDQVLLLTNDDQTFYLLDKVVHL